MDLRLERHPVYQQLNRRLRSALVGEYRRGDRFLTEREIGEKFQVSRATANKALASLVSEGLLEFRRGIGTFVRQTVIDYDVRTLVSFTEKAQAAGLRPSTELLAFRHCNAKAVDPVVRNALELTDEEVLWELERLRLADEVPVIFEHRNVVNIHYHNLSRSDAEGSLYGAWTERHNWIIGGADDVIRAVSLSTIEANRLSVPRKSPALEVVSLGFLESGAPLWWERTLYRADRCEFQSRLCSQQPATPARGLLRQTNQNDDSSPTARPSTH